MGHFCLRDRLTTMQVVRFRPRVMVRVEEGNAGEWTSKEEREWKQRTRESGKAKKEMIGKRNLAVSS